MGGLIGVSVQTAFKDDTVIIHPQEVEDYLALAPAKECVQQRLHKQWTVREIHVLVSTLNVVQICFH